MFGRPVRLFRMFGFNVRVDASWLIIALLVTWSLAAAFREGHRFPLLQSYRFPPQAAWLMGLAGAVGLFLSIVIHELVHSLVARRFGLPMRGITLFIFGGVAEMADEPPSPLAEFAMALSGPIASFLVGLFCYAVFLTVRGVEALLPVAVVFGYVGSINFVLAAFNLIPGFPLDGGRVLRSLLWHWKRSLRWATRMAAQVGSGFGLAFMVFGVLTIVFVRGGFVGGLWWLLIGLFLRSAASQSYQQVLIRQMLAGEPVRRFMSTEPATVPASTTIDQFVENYVYKHHHKMFPVVSDTGEALLGCVTVRRVREVPRDQWPLRTVSAVVAACSRANTISPDEDAMAALARMYRSRVSRLMVVDSGRLVGILTLKDLLRFLSLKLELEEGEEP